MRRTILGLLLVAVAAVVQAKPSSYYLDYTGYRLWQPLSWGALTYPELTEIYDVNTGCLINDPACSERWASTAEVLDMLLNVSDGQTSGPEVARIIDVVGQNWYIPEADALILSGYTRDSLTYVYAVTDGHWTPVSGTITTIPVPPYHDASFGIWRYVEVSEPANLALMSVGLLLTSAFARRRRGPLVQRRRRASLRESAYWTCKAG